MSDDIRIANSNIMTAFDEKTIGSKVIDKPNFVTVLKTAIRLHDWEAERVSGQAKIEIDKAAFRFVSCGTGRRSDNPDDYVLRIHRGRVEHYLRRKFAEPVNSLSVIVYTTAGYLDDPDVRNDTTEKMRIIDANPTHVLVALLATACPGFVSPYRFVANLAGGNKSYLPGNISVAELNDLAKKVMEYDDKYCIVAD